MIKKITVIQKDRTRYTFIKDTYEDSNEERYRIETMQLYSTGASATTDFVSRDYGNNFYKKAIARGFKKFRSLREVSWYATVENNTPYEEKWETEGVYLVPIVSRVLA